MGKTVDWTINFDIIENRAVYLPTARTIRVDRLSIKLESNETGSGSPYGNSLFSSSRKNNIESFVRFVP